MLAILPLATVVAEDIAYADGKVVAQSKAQNDSTWNKRGLINRLLDYFNEANKPKAGESYHKPFQPKSLQMNAGNNSRTQSNARQFSINA